MKIEATAPGKLVVIGEYGVLFGGPALVMAVNRRARVELRPAEGTRWILTAPEVAPRPAHLDVSPDGEMRWCDEIFAEQHFALVDRLLGAFASDRLVPLEDLVPAAATLDTTRFFQMRGEVRKKLGIGSSAALTVALATALVGWSAAGRAPSRDLQWLRTLVGLHRKTQGGLGSGIDVAASLLGGMIDYRLNNDGSVANAAPVELPGDLGFLCVWTGRSASTGSFLKRLEESRRVDRSTVERAIDRVIDVSEAGVEAVKMDSSSEFLEAVGRFWDAIERLGRVIEMPIVSDEHRRLRRMASDMGVRYKPSGAGGGDFGLAFDTDPGRLAALAGCAEDDGFEIVPLGLDPVGAACDVVVK